MLALTAVSCRGDDNPTLVIGGIPDEDISILEERFNAMADYLSGELGIRVVYRPSIDYAALVTAFRQGDVQLSWFGGLTGIQARLAAPGSEAIIQRPRDQEFYTVFIVNAGVEAETLADLKGKSFTFGSESSTSGHVMPRSFLLEAGIDPERDFRGLPSYSGSHDTTWKLVETGAFEAGGLNEAVWDRAVATGQVDTSRVRVISVEGPSYNYHWVAHRDLDQTYGAGTLEKVREALLEMTMDDPAQARILELFQTDRFIETENSNYDSLAVTARSLGLIE